MRDGDVLARTEFTRTARTGRTTIDDLVDPGRVLDHLADGATVVLQALQRWWPPLTAFCRALEVDLGHPVQVNAYLTPQGAAGLAPHHDTHDVFVLQVHGTKAWTVHEPVVEAPLGRHTSDHERAAAQPVLFDAELRTGDCLYLPRGYVHAASAQSALSLHLTVGVLATTVHDLLRRALDRAADEDPAFRRSLPPGCASDPALATVAVKEALAELTAWIARLDPEPLGADLVRRFRGNRRPILDGQLLELDRIDQIDDRTPLRPRPLTSCDVERDGDRLCLSLGDRRLELPARVAPAVSRLLDGSARCAADLGDHLDARSRMVLVRRLVREGVLVTAVDDA